VLDGPTIILALKVAVLAVTVLLLASLVALAYGKYRLHGRINTAFFVLTASALIALEVIMRWVDPAVFAYLESDSELKRGLAVHLGFAIPATVLMGLMLLTGSLHRRHGHLVLAPLFVVLWTGTVVTGLFFLR
jgi:hypothetical protein